MQGINPNLLALLENHQSENRKGQILLLGSSRSGKTFSTLEYFIMCCLQMPGLVCDVFRYDARRHDTGAALDFLTLMRSSYIPAWASGGWQSVKREFAFGNGSMIRFIATQDADKLKGPARDMALFNEATEIPPRSYDQVAMRTRLLIVSDSNPSDVDHLVIAKLLKNPDALVVHSTYKDNPHLSPEQVAVIESYDPSNPVNVANGTADKYLHEVFALGIPSRREGAVFTNWEIVDEWPLRSACQRCAWGLDWGFSVDPTAIVCGRLVNNSLYLREYLYETGLIVAPSADQPHVPSVIGRLRDGINHLIHPEDWIFCDSAQPESIKQLQLASFRVRACKKGPGSVLKGINRLKQFKICVHRSSVNAIREFRNYIWRTPQEPVDKDNHTLDSARYLAEEFRPFTSNDIDHGLPSDPLARLWEIHKRRERALWEGDDKPKTVFDR